MSKPYVLSCAMLFLICEGAVAERSHPDLQVTLPPAVFERNVRRVQPCNQCCVYQNERYSEGAVIKTEGILLQCQRDKSTLSTNPLVWRRVRE